jgi:uncharacterized repeat protein (TIGR02543 family)
MNRISSFLVVAALIAGMVGCVSSPTQYNLTISSTEGGETGSLGEGTFACYEGDVVNLVAIPASGYRFVGWTGSVDTIENVEAPAITIIMNGDCSVTANFEAIGLEQHNLTVSSSAGGSITTPGQGMFPYDLGTRVSLVATPATGYRFVSWTGDVDTIASINAASTTITMNGDYSLTANFELIPPVRYSLTVSSSAGGSVTTPGQGTFSYNAGAVVSLVAVPATGYRFVNWTGNVGTVANVSAASTTVTINGDGSITANFEPIPRVRYNLTITSSSGGWVTSPGMGTFSYDAGAVVSLVANPTCIYQYQFATWTGDVGTIANTNAASTTITMNGSCSIRANFMAIPLSQYSLFVSSTAGGSVTAPGEGTFMCSAGAVLNLVAVPATGYQFVNWTGNVGTITNVNAASTTITMNGAYSITANFQAIPSGQYNLTISSTTGGSVTTPGAGTFTRDAGTVVSLVATPAAGYHFVNWTGNVGTIANVNAASTTITMSGAYSITANFQAIPSGQYNLTISGTSGGSVTTPGAGTFTRDAGTVVGLVATPATGYHFVNWTGDVGTVANVNAASTTITMNGSYSVTAVFAEDSPSPPGIGYTESQAEQLIIALVNGQRQQSGLPALSEDALLASLAKEHSISMVEHNFFSHDRYPGERSFSYGQLPGTIRGENIAMIPTRQYIPGPYLSLQDVCAWAVSLWMNSPGHRANILRSNFTRTGVGVAFSEGGDYLYITQMFEGNY